MLGKINILKRYTNLLLKDFKWTVSSKISRYLEGEKTRKIIEWKTNLPEFGNSKDLINFLRDNDIKFNEGNHTIYIPPQKKLKLYMSELINFYPENCGFKILKQFGNPKSVNYLGNLDNHSARLMMRKQIIGNPIDQVKVANFLYYFNLGPRIHDISVIKLKNVSLTLYAVENIVQKKATIKQCEAFVLKIEELIDKTPLRLITNDWKNSGDFKCPNCNNNLFVNTNKNEISFYYVDFQNFFLSPVMGWMNDIVSKHNKVLSFGNSRLWRGSKYLYQSVEQSKTSAKRNTDKRWSIITKAIRKSDTLQNRIILDIGCNAGMFMRTSLFDGALWAYGWDLPKVAEIAEEILLAFGETRFSVFKTKLTKKTNLMKYVDKKHVALLNESVVLYLAIMHHVGFIENIKNINCRFFIYEGHQGEKINQSKNYLKCLFDKNMYVYHEQYITDGDSYNRPLIILKSK